MPFAKITSEGQSWELIHLHENASCLIREWFKKMPKSSFQMNFCQNDTHFNKLLYQWTANYCDKQVNQCPYTFSSIWPSCFYKVKHTGDRCNGVDRLLQWCYILNTIWWTSFILWKLVQFETKIDLMKYIWSVTYISWFSNLTYTYFSLWWFLEVWYPFDGNNVFMRNCHQTLFERPSHRRISKHI